MSSTDQELLTPARDRVDIEWSVALSQSAISTDRFVVYGLEPAEMLRYLDLRGGADLSVVIRTQLVKDGRAYQHAGGAVVAGIISASLPETAMLPSRTRT